MPRYDKNHKTETRRRIIETASRRLKLDGIDGSGVSTLMADAGLTNGAFYAHFESKNDLVATVLDDQLRSQAATIADLPAGRAAIVEFIGGYLSPEHRDDPGAGCPSGALLDEIVRLDGRGRDAYTAGVESIIDAVARHLSPDEPAAARRRATGLFTLLVGTLQLARAVSDPVLSESVLAAGISSALELLELDS
ncbi:TetR/AcrR family transcriptional regulator [Antrihabitans sp. YC3-6]|uniref:TetR/AcrR family transcriptional regulator n=1 Tax=Antrihabitans stalagmiti TaxID=2799499 RepID=A0A934NTX4_9NOCA|nr:TetR/AcrR family transcriptional regulator [Antrihabitans stalagmiti]MBJ8341232.1 TetR/AcrR family transcriptional regulator [Antrihabitans stalagmiti]